MRLNGQDGKICLIVSGRNFPAKSSNTISQMHNNMETLKNLTQLTIMDELTSSRGGFPCQPFSVAGKRKGTEDERHLWPEMLRIIGECQPRWVVGENVRGLVNWSDGLVLEACYSDLENLGYSVQSFIIPACATGTLPTDATEFGLLLTPTTSEPVHDLEKFKARMEKYPNGTTMPNLATQVHGMLPTPMSAARQARYRRRRPRQPNETAGN